MIGSSFRKEEWKGVVAEKINSRGPSKEEDL
jgi:hypothetical protein